MSYTVKQKQRLTLKTKLEILQTYDSTKDSLKVGEIAKCMKIHRRTLISIINNRQSLEASSLKDGNRFRVRNKKSNPQAGKSRYHELNKRLANWLQSKKDKNEPCTGSAVKIKAKEFADAMGLVGFTASNGWSDRFRKKFNLASVKKECCCRGRADSAALAEITISFFESLQQRYLPDKVEVIDVEENLLQWLNKLRENKVRVNNVLIKETSLAIAGILGVTKFTAPTSWFEKFTKKNKIFEYWQCTDCENNQTLLLANNDDNIYDDQILNTKEIMNSVVENEAKDLAEPSQETVKEKNEKLINFINMKEKIQITETGPLQQRLKSAEDEVMNINQLQRYLEDKKQKLLNEIKMIQLQLGTTN